MSGHEADESKRHTDEHTERTYERISTWIPLAIPTSGAAAYYYAHDARTCRDGSECKTNTKSINVFIEKFAIN